MNYLNMIIGDIHIGDIVELKTGEKGCIIEEPKFFPTDYYDFIFKGKIIITYQLLNSKNRYEWIGTREQLPIAFRQIGEYTFVSQQKIELLEYVKKTQKMATTLEFKNGEFLNSKKGLTDIFEKTSDVEIIDKINEIIKYINDKENN